MYSILSLSMSVFLPCTQECRLLLKQSGTTLLKLVGLAVRGGKKLSMLREAVGVREAVRSDDSLHML